MKNFFLLLIFLLISTHAAAYAPGERTIKLLGETLNSDKHPLHLVLEQDIDMQPLLTEEAFAKLPSADRTRHSRTEYNEINGEYSERNTTTNADGVIVRDICSFCRNGRWYSIDYLAKTYDDLPELPGMSLAFAETLVSWFMQQPETGHDQKLGWDYDKLRKDTDNELYFYYTKDGEEWLGMQEKYLSLITISALSQEVDEATAFQLPPPDFQRLANERMRNYAARLMLKQQMRQQPSDDAAKTDESGAANGGN